jgi:hypothetical protein
VRINNFAELCQGCSKHAYGGQKLSASLLEENTLRIFTQVLQFGLLFMKASPGVMQDSQADGSWQYH